MSDDGASEHDDRADPARGADVSSLHTLEDATVQSEKAAARGRTIRRLVVVAMALFVGAGVAGLLGYRSATVTDGSGPYELTVHHPAITRAGLPSNWDLSLVRTDGQDLGGSIDVQTTASYFDLFDQNGLEPAPEGEWQDEEVLVWTYEPGPGDTALVLHYDGRLQPNLRGWWDAETTVLVDDARVATVSYRTVAMP